MPELCDRQPISLSIDGIKTLTEGWRAVLILLSEAAIDAGKEAAIPKPFFRSGPSSGRSLETRLKSGQWLYTNINKASQIIRINTLAQLLDNALTVTFKDGGTVRLPFVQSNALPTQDTLSPTIRGLDANTRDEARKLASLHGVSVATFITKLVHVEYLRMRLAEVEDIRRELAEIESRAGTT